MDSKLIGEHKIDYRALRRSTPATSTRTSRQAAARAQYLRSSRRQPARDECSRPGAGPDRLTGDAFRRRCDRREVNESTIGFRRSASDLSRVPCVCSARCEYRDGVFSGHLGRRATRSLVRSRRLLRSGGGPVIGLSFSGRPRRGPARLPVSPVGSLPCRVVVDGQRRQRVSGDHVARVRYVMPRGHQGLRWAESAP